MPMYDGLLSPEELDSLVDYMIAMPKGPGSSPTASVAVDPVCHMKVRVTVDALHADFDGGTYYFCSESCRDRFTATPAAFTRD